MHKFQEQNAGQFSVNGQWSMVNGRASREGFSLLEVLIVVAISGSILLAIGSFRGNLDTLQNFLNQKLQSRQDIDPTLQIMESEIRSAGISSNGAYSIESAATSSFVFFSDIDKNGVFEKVRYFFTTSTIRKGTITPTGNPLVYVTSSEAIKTVITNVIMNTSTPVFSYYDTNYTGSQSPMTYPIDVTKIRVVRFAVYADTNTSSTPKAQFFSKTISIRNVRSN